jgi:hypothetical protein
MRGGQARKEAAGTPSDAKAAGRPRIGVFARSSLLPWGGLFAFDGAIHARGTIPPGFSWHY